MKKFFGRIPWYKGDWVIGTIAQNKYRYTYLGSEFQSTRDNNDIPPLDERGQLNSGWVIISQGVNILDEILPNVDDSVPSSAAIYNANELINNKIDLLASDVKVSVSVSSSVVYKGRSQTVDVVGRMNNGNPEHLKIDVSGETLIEGDTNPISTTDTFKIVSDVRRYDIEGIILGMILENSISIQARYPIYYGFGANAADVAVEGNKYAATTSAKHIYEKTNTSAEDQLSFYILVPSDIEGLTTFVMNGAPFVMEPETTTIVQIDEVDVTYKVYKSANVYNPGITVKVETN